MKKILIDTHIFLWWLSDDKSLKKEHYDLISDPDNLIYVSVLSLFEISLKVKKGKLKFDSDFADILRKYDIQCLNLDFKHIETFENLSFLHTDPFDLFLISQAISENFDLLSYDGKP